MLRVLRHLLTPFWVLRLHYPSTLLASVEERVGQIERRYHAEVRFVVEHALEPGDLVSGLTPRERALEVFGLLGVWDTEHNNGVLIHVLHAERSVEIVADRGIARMVPQADWDALCRQLETRLRAGQYAAAVTEAIEAVARLLEQHQPVTHHDAVRNELPDQPLLL